MSFWPWRLMPLGAQVIGAWLLALAVATALVIWERDLDRLLVPAVTYTAFGVFQLLVALRYWTQIRPDYQWGWAYVGLLVSIASTAPTDVGGHPQSAVLLDEVEVVGVLRADALEELQGRGDRTPLARRACSVLRSRQRVSPCRQALCCPPSSSLRISPSGTATPLPATAR